MSLAALAALLVGAAQASPFTVIDEAILDPATTAEYPAGMGAPTLIWDRSQAVYRIYFETEVHAPGCGEAWTIGAARSPDGLTWTPDEPVLSPMEGTAWPCGARRPAVAEGPKGQLVLFFNVVDAQSDDGVGMMQLGAARTTPTPTLPPRPRLSRSGPLPDRGDLAPSLPDRGDLLKPSVRLLPNLHGLLAPTVTSHDGEWLFVGVRNDPAAQDLVSARSPDLKSWTVDDRPAVRMGAARWAADGVLSPSLLCQPTPTYGYQLYFGGWSGARASWSWGVSDNGNSWFLAPALESWTADDAWLSWDAVNAGPVTLVVFETLDPSGRPRIGLAADAPSWTPTEATTRRCLP